MIEKPPEGFSTWLDFYIDWQEDEEDTVFMPSAFIARVRTELEQYKMQEKRIELCKTNLKRMIDNFGLTEHPPLEIYQYLLEILEGKYDEVA